MTRLLFYCLVDTKPHVKTIQVLFLALGLVALTSSARAKPPQLSLVAMAGAQIAGLEDNETLIGWSFEKGINLRGEVIFAGGISTKDAEGNSSLNGRGIWVGEPGKIRLLARDGQTAPGWPGDFIFTEILKPLVFNNRGEVAFMSRIGPDRRTHEATALFLGTPGNLRMVAQDGEAAPGFEEANGRLQFQTVINRSDQSRLSLSDTGAIAWTASVVQASRLIDFGVWLTQDGTTELLSLPLSGAIPGQFVALDTSSDGSVTFYESDSASTLYHWKESKLTQIARLRQEIGESNTKWMRLGGPYFQKDHSLVFSARTRENGSSTDEPFIYRWKDGSLQQVAQAQVSLVDGELFSDSISLDPIPGIDLVTYTACGKHPVDPERFCQDVLQITDGTSSRVIAYEGMPFPNETQGTEIVLDGVPGLIDKRIVANGQDTVVIHLGKRGPDGELRQAIYRVEESDYSPIIEQGDIVDLGDAGQGTAVRFHVFANTSHNEPLRALNDADQLLFSISTEEHRDALVVATVSPLRSPSLRKTPEGIVLEWDGDGILESAPQVSGPWHETPNQALRQAIESDDVLQFFRKRKLLRNQ